MTLLIHIGSVGENLRDPSKAGGGVESACWAGSFLEQADEGNFFRTHDVLGTFKSVLPCYLQTIPLIYVQLGADRPVPVCLRLPG